MFAKTTAMAARKFLSKLPEEVVMLALEAVELQARLDRVSDRHTRDDIQHQLELINRRIIHSAINMFY
ncbi:MAG: hypothetical protein IJ201_00065 [Solobacterium sp.]|nr:hypothetical protein [Solobacterium sp.]